ncbi:hypothetical protein [Geobacter grbiciae]|uniref:hypothetical protein n=1 Tax=Geobacter grbiciae TaxID=155042 RepID=UPI001C02C625|nr:hypothetical protein [Geobacter grbiciae]MBT1075749.1 hypothetical protein [Geobacter grbiciae]
MTFSPFRSIGRVAALLTPVLFIIAGGLCFYSPADARPLSIGIIAPPSLLAAPVARNTVNDALRLVQESFPCARISLNDSTASIRLVLPALNQNNAATLPGTVAQSYTWTSRPTGSATVLTLSATTAAGVSNGLYGLLQERLGYRFIHPRQTIVPRHATWPLPGRFRWSATPRFASRGFHLHTLHPTELATQLHDPSYPGALADVKEYIDWLARNGQNTTQFFLLRGVDRDRWPPHARAFVEYAHQRGVTVGVEISLSMLQQQAFQAVKLLRPFHRRQIDRNLAWLFQVPWDFVTLESATGEHLPRIDRLAPSLRNQVAERVTKRYGARFFHATHVIRPKAEEANGTPPRVDELPRDCGILVHTVMCYSASEEKAPVYGNHNQRFMLKLAEQESRRRETWYWPESSYWVAFDNSVPQMLLPYLSARHHDMMTMERLGVTGHLTFTSGWEWGYWLTDWSIARWSWRHVSSGREELTSPLSVLGDIFPDRRLRHLWSDALTLQEHYLKNRELLRYTAALAPFSEMPWPFNRPFQPEPPFRYEKLIESRDTEGLLGTTVTDLEAFSQRMERLALEISRESERFEATVPNGKEGLRGISRELERGLTVTALRAGHRALTIRASMAQRQLPPEKRPGAEALRLLARAAAVRERALVLVKEQEAGYRYPVNLVARKRTDLTAYGFGYLYPVSELHFWKREEEQARRLRFDALFMNLWDFRRTLGLESLLF